MNDLYEPMLPYIESSTFPIHFLHKIAKLGICGLQIKGYGSPGLSTLEAGAIIYELSKRDGNLVSSFVVHNCLALAVIDAMGSDE